jgi:hypothetical protein
MGRSDIATPETSVPGDIADLHFFESFYRNDASWDGLLPTGRPDRSVC